MSHNVLIGLLCNNLKPISFYSINEDLPVTLVKFTSKGIRWKDRKIQGIILKNNQWQQGVTSFPDVVYNRCYTNKGVTTSRLEKEIGKGKVFNSFTRFDKYEVYSILKENGLEDLVIPTDYYELETLLNRLDEEGSVLIKPRKGSMGRNIYKFTKEGKEYKMHVQTHYPIKIFKSAHEFICYLSENMDFKDYIIQPFISFAAIEDHLFDLRMLVQKNYNGLWDVTADMSRVGYKNFFVTNTAYGVQPIGKVLEDTAFSLTIVTDLRAISIKVARILENFLCSLGEISVDFGITANGKLWIIEVNGKPEKTIFGEINNETLEKVFLTPIEYAAYLATT